MRVSVVIPVRDAASVIGGQLDALASQDYDGDWEVVVCDHASADGTAELVAGWVGRLPVLRVVRAPAGRGVNRARNIGAAAARGELIVFCDADDAAEVGWLSAMVAGAGDADLVGGWLDHSALNSPRVRGWRPGNSRDEPPVALEFLPYAVGASLAVHARVFQSLGGFDEGFARGGDDVEFSWRAQLAGYRLGFAPNAVMRYRLRDRLWPLARQGFGYGQADARLYRGFRRRGVPPFDLRTTIRDWSHLLRNAPALADRERAGGWIYWASWRWGRVVGSVRYRVRCL